MKLKRKREVEANLLSLGNIVDPSEAFWGTSPQDLWGTLSRSKRRSQPYSSFPEFEAIINRARDIHETNPYAQNLITNLTSFIIGKGHSYKVAPKNKEVNVSDEVLQDVQTFIDDLLKLNKWKKRQKEILRRKHRDGESPMRVFEQTDGFTRFRFVDPLDIRTPKNKSKASNVEYGVHYEDGDVETHVGYYVDNEEIDATEMMLRTENVDMNVLRGLSTFYCIGEDLERSRTLLRNMSAMLAIQTAIGMIRRHKKKNPNAITKYANSKKYADVYDRNSNKTHRVSVMRPGTIIDSDDNIEYEFPKINPVSNSDQILAAVLRSIASAKALPEYMIGSDASNANFASTMVAESPAVRYFESEQDEQIEEDIELIWKAIEYASDGGLLPGNLEELITIEVTPPRLISRKPKEQADTDNVYLTHRIKSPQTIQNELNLDPEIEANNWREWDDENLDDTLPAPDFDDEEDDDVPDVDDEDVQETVLKYRGGKLSQNAASAKLRRKGFHPNVIAEILQ